MSVSVVLYVGDLARMQAFYAGCFGFVGTDGGTTYRGMERGSWRITMVQSLAAQPSTSPAPRRVNNAVKLAFEVGSIDAIGPIIASLGGRIDPRDTWWEFRNAIHCDGLDPEGNVVQLIQPSMDTNR